MHDATLAIRLAMILMMWACSSSEHVLMLSVLLAAGLIGRGGHAHYILILLYYNFPAFFSILRFLPPKCFS